MSKIGRIGQIRTFLTGQLFGAFLDAVPLLGLVPALVILNWRLSLFVFVMTAIIFAIGAVVTGLLMKRGPLLGASSAVAPEGAGTHVAV